MAYEAYLLIARRDELAVLSDKALRRTGRIIIPARTEILHIDSKMVVLDGAHNGQKMQAAVHAVREIFPIQKVAALVGMLEDKEMHLHEVMQQLTEFASNISIIATGFSVQDLPRKPLDPQRIAEECQKCGFSDVLKYDQLEEAVRALMARPERILLVTGSFYMMHTVRTQLYLIAQSHLNQGNETNTT